MASGLPDFRSPVDIAASTILAATVEIIGQSQNLAVNIAEQIGNLATDITAQTLAALNTDYRYGTAGDSEGSQAINTSPLTLVSLSGKGIVFGGGWIIDRDEANVAPGLANTLKYQIDGVDHNFFPLDQAALCNWSEAKGYQPSVTLLSAIEHKAAGYLPGPITFESSFKIIVKSTDTSGDDEIEARIFYAIAL